MKTCGVNSYAGRVAAVMLGASETSIYTISLYAGSVNLKDTRYAVPAALIGDLTAFIVSAWMVRICFGQ
jgi:spore maturation protein B